MVPRMVSLRSVASTCLIRTQAPNFLPASTMPTSVIDGGPVLQAVHGVIWAVNVPMVLVRAVPLVQPPLIAAVWSATVFGGTLMSVVSPMMIDGTLAFLSARTAFG